MRLIGTVPSHSMHGSSQCCDFLAGLYEVCAKPVMPLRMTYIGRGITGSRSPRNLVHVSSHGQHVSSHRWLAHSADHAYSPWICRGKCSFSFGVNSEEHSAL